MVADAAIVTDAVRLLETVIVSAFDVTVWLVTQLSFEVITQVTSSPSVSTLLKVALFVPASLPFIFH